MEKNGIFFDLIVHVEETFPFRPKNLIDNMIIHLLNKGLNTVVASKNESKSLWHERNDGKYQRIDKIDNIFGYTKNEILKQFKINIPNKLLLIAEAFRKKISLQKIYKLSKVDPWFLNQIKEIVEEENKII